MVNRIAQLLDALKGIYPDRQKWYICEGFDITTKLTPDLFLQSYTFSMEPDSLKKEALEEFTRESLIEISQLNPETEISSSSAAAKHGVRDGGEADEYRSKLISISYTQSPDGESPAALENSLYPKKNFSL